MFNYKLVIHYIDGTTATDTMGADEWGQSILTIMSEKMTNNRDIDEILAYEVAPSLVYSLKRHTK